jgi:hypothetical protein
VDVLFVSGSLSGQIHGDTVGELPPGMGLLFDGPEGTTGLVSPGGAYSFLGVEAGETIHVWPQGGEPGRMYLGFAAESIAPGTLASYLESDGRVASSAPWIKISLADVRFHPAPGVTDPGHFSLWQTGSFGLTVWMSTAEGGSPITMPPGFWRAGTCTTTGASASAATTRSTSFFRPMKAGRTPSCRAMCRPSTLVWSLCPKPSRNPARQRSCSAAWGFSDCVVAVPLRPESCPEPTAPFSLLIQLALA